MGNKEGNWSDKSFLVVVIAVIVLAPFILFFTKDLFMGSINGMAESKVEDIESQYELGIPETFEIHELGFEHNFGEEESGLGNDGIVYKTELEYFNKIRDNYRSQSTYEAGVLDNEGNTKRYQGIVSIHYIQDNSTEPVFVIDGYGNVHVWLDNDKSNVAEN